MNPPTTPSAGDGKLAELQPRLRNFFAARVAGRTEREELLGRLNLRLLERIRGADDIQDLERFAFGVARNVLNEHWRELQRQNAVETTLSSTAENLGRELSTTMETAPKSHKALLRALQECLGDLSAGDRDIADRCYGDGKSKNNRQVLALELSLTRNALDARISRIRSRLEACVRQKLAQPAP